MSKQKQITFIFRYLDKWFGNETIELVEPSSYPKGISELKSKTVFKVFKTEEPREKTELYIISVRGTTSATDLLSDAQIWLPAFALQVLRFLLP